MHSFCSCVIMLVAESMTEIRYYCRFKRVCNARHAVV